MVYFPEQQLSFILKIISLKAHSVTITHSFHLMHCFSHQVMMTEDFDTHMPVNVSWILKLKHTGPGGPLCSYFQDSPEIVQG